MKLLKQLIIGLVVVLITIIVTILLRQNIFKFDKKLTTENKQIIENYIYDLNLTDTLDSSIFLSTHYFGSRYNNDMLEVYVWVLWEEYITQNKEFILNKEINKPGVVIINTKDEKFEIVEYKYQESTNDIKLFPLAIKSEVLKFKNSSTYDKLKEEHKDMIDTYKKYFEGEE